MKSRQKKRETRRRDEKRQKEKKSISGRSRNCDPPRGWRIECGRRSSHAGVFCGKQSMIGLMTWLPPFHFGAVVVGLNFKFCRLSVVFQRHDAGRRRHGIFCCYNKNPLTICMFWGRSEYSPVALNMKMSRPDVESLQIAQLDQNASAEMFKEYYYYLGAQGSPLVLQTCCCAGVGSNGPN